MNRALAVGLSIFLMLSFGCKEATFERPGKYGNGSGKVGDCDPFPNPVIVVPEKGLIGEKLQFHTELVLAEWQIETDNGLETFYGQDVEITYSSAGLFQGEVEGLNACEYPEKYLFSFQVFKQEAPEVDIVEFPPKLEFTGEAQFKFVGQSHGGGAIVEYRCSLAERGIQSCSSPVKYADLANGPHKFSVVAIDEAGNESAPAEYEWEVDRNEPEVFLTKVPDHPTFDDFAEFEFSGHSPAGLSHFECDLDGQPFDRCESPFYKGGLVVGEHRFQVVAVDNIGRKSSPAVFTWQIKKRPTLVKEDFISPGGGNTIDILFVIDNSGSMWKEHSQIKYRMRKFFNNLNGLDWQMAFITTDGRGRRPGEAGRFLRIAGAGHKHILTPKVKGAERRFLNTIFREKSGSNYEEGIRATSLALDRIENQRFFRDGAHFSMVIVADEDEGSNGTGLKKANQPEYLIEKIRKKWQGKKDFAGHTLVWQPDSGLCRTAMHRGHTYARLSRLTQGIQGSVCARDYGRELKNIADYVGAGDFDYNLQCEPLGGEYKVTYDPDPGFDIVTTLSGLRLNFSPVPPKDTKVSLEYECFVRRRLP